MGISRWMVTRIPLWLADLSGPLLQLSVGEVRSENCFFQVCLSLNDIQLTPLSGSPLVIPHTTVRIQPHWPVRLTVQTDAPIQLDATFQNGYGHIRKFQGQCDRFYWHASGEFWENRGTLIFKTIGLNRFLNRFMVLPPMFNLWIKDTPQTLELTAQNGWLTFLGIPLIPLTKH